MNDTALKNSQPSRKAVMQSAAWSVPIITAAVAAPAFAASPNCPPLTLDWTTATFSRTSANAASFTWSNPFGTGTPLVMNINAVRELANTTLHTENLTQDARNVGGAPVDGGLVLALVTANNTVDQDHGGENVTFSFQYGGSPFPVQNLSFRVGDIDGNVVSNSGAGSIPGGAERVWTDQGTGTFLTGGWQWLIGDGTRNKPWRRRADSTPSGPNSSPSDTFAAVRIDIASTSAFTLRYRVNGTGNTEGTVNRVFLSPFNFMVTDPTC